MTLFGCNNKDAGSQKEEDDGLVSVWLMTSETSYEADGSKGYAHVTYTYNDKGMPLTTVYDYGVRQQVYNEEMGIYLSEVHDYDGKEDLRLEYAYTDHGDLRGYVETHTTYEENGNALDTKVNDYCNGMYDFHYDDRGRLSSVDMHLSQLVGGFSDKLAVTNHFCYDDNGRIFEIYVEKHEGREWEKIRWGYEFRYDDHGQMTTSATYFREGLIFDEYIYDAEGHLTKMTEYIRPYGAPLDDQQTVTPEYVPKEPIEASERESVAFTYDSAGKLTGRTGTVPAKCTYDDSGKLKTVNYSDGNKFVYVDSDDNVDTDATYLVRDENGNVVKIVRPDGSYMVFTYQKFGLSAEDAARCNAVRLANDYATPYGESRSEQSWLRFLGSFGYIDDLPIPETALHFTDEMLARDYRNH